MYMRHLFLFWIAAGYLMLHPFNSFASTPQERQLRAAKHDSTRLRLYTELARKYLLENKFDSSLRYIKSGLQLATKLNITRYHCKLYTLWCFMARLEKQYDTAIKTGKLAIDFGKKISNISMLSISAIFWQPSTTLKRI